MIVVNIVLEQLQIKDVIPLNIYNSAILVTYIVQKDSLRLLCQSSNPIIFYQCFTIASLLLGFHLSFGVDQEGPDSYLLKRIEQF